MRNFKIETQELKKFVIYACFKIMNIICIRNYCKFFVWAYKTYSRVVLVVQWISLLLSLREKLNDHLSSKYEFWKVSDVGGPDAFIEWFLFKCFLPRLLLCVIFTENSWILFFQNSLFISVQMNHFRFLFFYTHSCCVNLVFIDFTRCWC